MRQLKHFDFSVERLVLMQTISTWDTKCTEKASNDTNTVCCRHFVADVFPNENFYSELFKDNCSMIVRW